MLRLKQFGMILRGQLRKPFRFLEAVLGRGWGKESEEHSLDCALILSRNKFTESSDFIHYKQQALGGQMGREIAPGGENICTLGCDTV